jgi:hypothetical protein
MALIAVAGDQQRTNTIQHHPTLTDREAHRFQRKSKRATDRYMFVHASEKVSRLFTFCDGRADFISTRLKRQPSVISIRRRKIKKQYNYFLSLWFVLTYRRPETIHIR